MNWYSIFYWVTVADGVKTFFDWFSNLFTVLSFIALLALIFSIVVYKDENTDENEKPGIKYWISFFRKCVIWTVTLCVLTWAGYVFIPSKKDCMVIIAGGAVGNFITKDTAARQIPGEVMLLLRNKIRAEITEINTPVQVKDTLESKTKEELVALLKELKSKNN